jgi:hypothetical protein
VHSSMPYHDMKKVCIGEMGLCVSCVESVGPNVRISRTYDIAWGTSMPAPADVGLNPDNKD